MKTLNYTHLDEKGANNIVVSLQQLLADFQIHYANLRGFHWNIKGHGFFVLHGKFEDLYNGAAEKVDEIAERILMLGGTPANKYSDYLKMAQIKEVDGVSKADDALNHILETYGHLIAEERKVLSLASSHNDEVTVAMMSDYLKEQEKMVWMLTAYNRITPNRVTPFYLKGVAIQTKGCSHPGRIATPFLFYPIQMILVRFVNSIISGIYPNASPVTVSAHP